MAQVSAHLAGTLSGQKEQQTKKILPPPEIGRLFLAAHVLVDFVLGVRTSTYEFLGDSI